VLEGDGVVFHNNEEGAHDPLLITPLERIHNGHPSPNNRTYKLLGILLDEHLALDKNTQALLAKLSRAAHFMNKVKHAVPQKALLSLYYALGHSHLTYCPIITSSTSATNVNKIVKAQKKLLRIACKQKYTEHTQPLFTKHEILNYHKIILQAKLQFMHSIHYKHAPLAFDNTWRTNQERELGYTLRNGNNYTLPRVNYSFTKHSPLYSLPDAWNNSGPVKYHSNFITFKISLKEHLLLQQAEQHTNTTHQHHTGHHANGAPS
jgi:hypothetical protein